jgi:hypothetical protein
MTNAGRMTGIGGMPVAGGSELFYCPPFTRCPVAA